MSRDAPTPQLHVQHFLSTVEDYERLGESFPLGTGINVFGHRQDDEARWRVTLHAILLRKYFAPADRLHLKRVMKSVRGCVVKDDLQAEDWDHLLENIAHVRPTSLATFAVDRTYDESQVLEHELYGRYLHGDFEKWEHTLKTGNTGSDTMVFMATSARADRVSRFTELVRVGIRDGALVID